MLSSTPDKKPAALANLTVLKLEMNVLKCDPVPGTASDDSPGHTALLPRRAPRDLATTCCSSITAADPKSFFDVPMDPYSPDGVTAHLQFMQDFAERLQASYEYIDGHSPQSTYVRYDGHAELSVTVSPLGDRRSDCQLDGSGRG